MTFKSLCDLSPPFDLHVLQSTNLFNILKDAKVIVNFAWNILIEVQNIAKHF